MLDGIDLVLGHGIRASVTLRLAPGCIHGLFGPSGVGKTTLGRALAGLHRPIGGIVRLDDAPLPTRGVQPVQYLAQDSLAAMNPRWTIARILAEGAPPDPDTARRVGIGAELADRYPHQLSGGELQRVAILRALTARPRFLIADEITSALDPVSQARIWHMLRDLAQGGIGILAISHDAPLLDSVAQRRSEWDELAS